MSPRVVFLISHLVVCLLEEGEEGFPEAGLVEVGVGQFPVGGVPFEHGRVGVLLAGTSEVVFIVVQGDGTQGLVVLDRLYRLARPRPSPPR
jgi:hypothetical protein